MSVYYSSVLGVSTELTSYVASLFTVLPKSTIFLLVAILVLPAIIRLFTPKIKGWIGEWMVRRILAKLPKEYQQWHDVYLLDSDGHTTQIDHIVASRHGIFVIETKNFKGWIFGTEKQKTWTQSIYGKKFKFLNPLHQNARHIRVLAESTEIDKAHFHNLIYFVGDATLKSELPDNIMTNDLREHIRYQNDEVLTAVQLMKFCSDVDRINLSKENGIRKRHIKSLQARHIA